MEEGRFCHGYAPAADRRPIECVVSGTAPALVGAGLGGGQLCGHPLGGREDGFHLGFGGGRVGYRLDGLAEPGCDVGTRSASARSRRSSSAPVTRAMVTGVLVSARPAAGWVGRLVQSDHFL